MTIVRPIARPVVSPVVSPLGGGGLPWEIGGGDSVWSPLNLGSNLALWLRADYANITDAGSGRVSAWTDRSGKGNTVVQATGADQPLWVDNVIAGRPVIRFAAANTEFLADTTSDADHTQPLTVFLVAKAGGANQIFFDHNATSLFGMYSNATSKCAIANATELAGTEAINGAFKGMCGEYNGASSNVYVGDFTTAEATGNAGAIGWVGANGFRVGVNRAGTGYLDGDIAEMIVLDALATQAERNQVRDYINRLYALGVT